MKAKKDLIHEGSTKNLYDTSGGDTCIMHFKDDLASRESEAKGDFQGKGVINNRISECIMMKLRDLGIPVHYLETINMREQLVTKANIVPIKLVMSNVAAGELAKRFNIETGTVLPMPIVEIFYKRPGGKGYTLINDDHISTFQWLDKFEIEEIKIHALRVNDFLTGLFQGIGIRLIDFRLEFGKVPKNSYEDQIIITDEISPDTCRLWDASTNNILDVDNYNGDNTVTQKTYQEIAKKLGVL